MKANQRLRRERELRAWSQAKVAEEVGTDPATVSRWERGLSFPYPYFRERLCTLFQKSPEELGLVQGLDESGGIRSSLVGTDYFYESLPPQTPIFDPAVPVPTARTLVGRSELLLEVQQHFYAKQPLPIVAFYGLPGVGKTALALHLAHDSALREHFFDGILWASLGPKPNILALLTRWGGLLGVSTTDPKNNSVAAWAEALRFAIGARRFLLVIDDAWNLSDALAFKIGGYNCACLLTTRFPHIALHYAADCAFPIYELSDIDGVTLLEHLAPELAGYEPMAVQELVHLAGGLPLALTLMGKYLRVQMHNRQPRRIRAAFAHLRETHARILLNEPYAPSERHSSLIQDIPLSLHAIIALSVQQLAPEEQQALFTLSLFPPKPYSFSEEAALAVTGQTYQVLDHLADAGLLESRGPGLYTLHRTISDYGRIQPNASSAYERFVAYFILHIENHQHEAAEVEIEALLTVLEHIAKQALQPELEEGISSFFAFLDARQHPYAQNLRALLLATT